MRIENLQEWKNQATGMERNVQKVCQWLRMSIQIIAGFPWFTVIAAILFSVKLDLSISLSLMHT